MIQGRIQISSQSKLVVIERDHEAPQEGYSSKSYIDALDDSLIEIYTLDSIFQQDNAKIHKSEHTQEWFECHRIHVIEQPPYSPDLNRIEVVQSLLKRELFKQYPSLANRRRRQIDQEEFRVALVDSQDHIDQDSIDRLILSMPRRIASVRATQGYYTRY